MDRIGRLLAIVASALLKAVMINAQTSKEVLVTAADTKRAASCISMPAAQVRGGSTQFKEEVRPEVSHNERQRDLPTGYKVVRVGGSTRESVMPRSAQH